MATSSSASCVASSASSRVEQHPAADPAYPGLDLDQQRLERRGVAVGGRAGQGRRGPRPRACRPPCHVLRVAGRWSGTIPIVSLPARLGRLRQVERLGVGRFRVGVALPRRRARVRRRGEGAGRQLGAAARHPRPVPRGGADPAPRRLRPRRPGLRRRRGRRHAVLRDVLRRPRHGRRPARTRAGRLPVDDARPGPQAGARARRAAPQRDRSTATSSRPNLLLRTAAQPHAADRGRPRGGEGDRCTRPG